MRRVWQLLSMIPALASARVALACPSCPGARLMGDVVCGDHLWTNLMMTTAPFATFAALTWALSRGTRRAR